MCSLVLHKPHYRFQHGITLYASHGAAPVYCIPPGLQDLHKCRVQLETHMARSLPVTSPAVAGASPDPLTPQAVSPGKSVL
jgi:hypothetical protein